MCRVHFETVRGPTVNCGRTPALFICGICSARQCVAHTRVPPVPDTAGRQRRVGLRLMVQKSIPSRRAFVPRAGSKVRVSKKPPAKAIFGECCHQSQPIEDFALLSQVQLEIAGLATPAPFSIDRTSIFNPLFLKKLQHNRPSSVLLEKPTSGVYI